MKCILLVGKSGQRYAFVTHVKNEKLYYRIKYYTDARSFEYNGENGLRFLYSDKLFEIIKEWIKQDDDYVTNRNRQNHSDRKLNRSYGTIKSQPEIKNQQISYSRIEIVKTKDGIKNIYVQMTR